MTVKELLDLVGPDAQIVLLDEEWARVSEIWRAQHAVPVCTNKLGYVVLATNQDLPYVRERYDV